MNRSSWLTRKNVLIGTGVIVANLGLIVGVQWVSAGHHAVKVGVVDMGKIMAARRNEYLRILAGEPNAKHTPDEEAALAQKYIDDTDKKLTETMLQIERDCGCVLLSRQTVVWSSNMKDYTERLIQTFRKREG